MSNPLDRLNERTLKAIEILSTEGVIPPYMAFDITEEMIAKAIALYGKLGPPGNGKFEWNFARRIWGLNLLKLKFSRGCLIKNCKEGMVYLIRNPAWPDYLKVGMTIDIDSRLSSYQTYDPHKAFRIDRYEFTLDRRQAEKELLDQFQIHLVDGEWIKHSDGLQVMRVLRSSLPQ